MVRLLFLADNAVDQKVTSKVLTSAFESSITVVSAVFSDALKTGCWGDILITSLEEARRGEVLKLTQAFRPAVSIGLLNRRNHSVSPALVEPFDGYLYHEHISVESMRPWGLLANERLANIEGLADDGIRILVAQSGTSVPPVIAALARKTGASITTMSDRPALDLLTTSKRFSLVVVDTMLPNFRSAQEIRVMRAAAPRVVAIVPPSSSEEERRRLLESADVVIPPESDPAVLQHLLDRMER